MSFLFGNSQALPQPEQRLMGLNATRASTNEQARPVPLLYGRQRVGITFLSQAFNIAPVKVSQDGGKKSVASGYNYYCGFAALICHGPVDRIHAAYFDDEQVWTAGVLDGVRDVGADSYGLMVGINSWLLYWGTETQGINDTLATLNTVTSAGGNPAEKHPAYRGQCYLVASHHFLGYNRTNIQNIEVVVSRWPVITWIPSAPKIDSDCNAAHAIADLLTNTRYGLGLRDAASDDTRLDRASFIAVAAQLDHEGLGISPLLNRSQTVRDILRAILEYIDGYLTSNAAGQIVLGLIRPLECGVLLPTIDEVALVAPPQLSIQGWETTTNDVRLAFTNRDADWKEDAATANDLGNLQITGEPAAQTLQRPWVTSPALADKLARVAAQVLATPKTTGRLTIRKSWLRGLRPGDVFKFNYSHYGICWLYCRVTDVTVRDGRQPEVDIAFEVDRAHLGQSLVTPPSYDAPVKPLRDPAAVTAALLLETPYNPARHTEPCLSFLIARPTPLTTRVRPLHQVATDSYASAGDLTQFTWHGTLSGAHDAGDASTLRVVFDAGTNLSDGGVLATSDDQELDKWLLVIRAPGDPPKLNATECEFISIQTPHLDSALTYDFASPLRGRKDTVALDLPDGAEVWLTNKTLLQACTIQLAEDGATQAAYKLQPAVLGKELKLSDCGDPWLVNLVGRAKKPWTPHGLAGTWNSGGIAVSWTPGVITPPRGGLEMDRWWIQLRLPDADATYPPVEAPPRLSYAETDTSANILPKDITEAVGGGVTTLILRIYARTLLGGYSLNYQEITLNKA